MAIFKRQNRKSILYIILTVFFSLLALFALYKIVHISLENYNAQKTYDNLRQVAETDDQSSGQSAAVHVDFEKLKELKDFIFWLDIPNTSISYPVMQGKDNSFYLTRMADGGKNRAGSIFMDYRSGLTSPAAVLYGHNMHDGTMFSDLMSYRDESFYKNHPYFWVLTEKKALRYEIFSAHIMNSDSDCYRLDFTQDVSMEDFISREINLSLYPVAVSPQSEDSKVLTLSTCTNADYDQRMVIHAVLTE